MAHGGLLDKQGYPRYPKQRRGTLSSTLVNLSTAHFKLGELARAKTLLDRALPTLERNEGVDRSALGVARTNLDSLNSVQDAASAKGIRMVKEAQEEHFGSELQDSAALAALACELGEIHLQVVLEEIVLDLEARRHGELEIVADRLQSLSRRTCIWASARSRKRH